MAKKGRILYTKKNFTDAEVQQEFGFPCILILHDNTSVIKKITAFDKIGTKTIYDFSLAATKDFVIQSIADAVAGLNDNVLEFNSYSDFPQPGEVGNIYIALDVDQIFVWNTESQSYVQQSWDAYVIQQLQTNISSAQMAFQNLQNSKLDKPNLSINNIPFWHQSGTFFNSNMSYINGNIGIGLSGGATEKLEVGGRTKSDGQVFNETTSAILPKEIKFKDGKFKAALDDGVEKSVLLEGDAVSGDSLVFTHIHTLNKELYFSSFDYTLGRAVCTQPHGLSIGVTYTAIIYVPNNWYEDGSVNLTTFHSLLKTIPFELAGSTGVRIYVVDSTTIEFRNSSNTPIVINPTSTENNTFIDFTKWHLEVDNYSGSTLKVNFTNVPKGIINFAINIQGLVNTGSVGLITYYVHTQDGSVVGNEISTQRLNARDSVSFPGLVAGRSFHHFNFYFESSVRNIFNPTFSEGYSIARNAGADNFGIVTLGRTMLNLRLKPACQNNLGLAGLQIHYPVIPNGTKIQIFRR